MLKLSSQGVESFHNMKCGEIFCITAAVFNVSCCLCGSEMHLEQFSSHFQIQHLTLVEESVNLEVLENQQKPKLPSDFSSLYDISIKEEDPVDDPIKEEHDPIKQEQELEVFEKSMNILENEGATVVDTEEDEDNKCLQELIILAKAKKEKPNYRGKLKRKGTAPKVDVSRKRPTRNAKKKREFVKEEDIEVPLPTEEHDDEIISCSILSKDEIYINEFDDNAEYNDGTEKKRSSEENDSRSDSEHDNDFTAEISFPCLICQRHYTTKNKLQKHNYSVHNPNKPVKNAKKPKTEYKCDECNEVFSSARNLTGHKWKHTGIVCDICGKVFSQRGNLIRHKIRHTGIKDHKCKECDKEFFTLKELTAHMIRHTGQMPKICEICGKRCRDGGVLTAHMRRHTGERPAKCEVCGKRFFSIHDLNVHAVAHSSERPFKCDICGSTFQRKKALRIHKLIHSKDRKHVCKICGKGFAQSSGLNTHMRTHDTAVEKTATSPMEASSVMQIPIMLMNRTEDTPQTVTVVVDGSREFEDQLVIIPI